MITLEKRAAKVAIVLEKRRMLKPPVVRVGAALDISGSAKALYQSGVIQETHDRILGIALKFDDNGEVDTWTFTEGYDRLPTATPDNYGTYITDYVLNGNITKWGGTQYAPVMNDIVDFFFRAPEPKREAKRGFLSRLFGSAGSAGDAPAPASAPAPANGHLPAWVLFVTDGQNPKHDRKRVRQLLTESQHYPLYWSLVGVGDPREFDFLAETAGAMPNVGFLHLESLDVTDEQIYEQLITQEFCDWVRAK
ncbi:Tellurium resistance protein [Burkholderia stagnalis]|uniref:VWA domain-containing protein n=1 Tax=Burkholderia stagnalis TaxID=1503054 RepID=UPI00075C5E96|nr:VWA domain-containing protein [Burkholderia stagnalis]KVD82681.1 Tellurium resistance protein [Burkholderia stagnalis]KVO60759.1 Tellurium resistance protein [Burkholderia stagnalis]KVP08790.1 Tellurium resistance protein [Burkholderia stagnalis]KVW90326.1 Tellurium resistance protein [Burkholderia stagnalis]KWH72298.1 Tellurium resistance protein [Burkholderia stagnalis]